MKIRTKKIEKMLTTSWNFKLINDFLLPLKGCSILNWDNNFKYWSQFVNNHVYSVIWKITFTINILWLQTEFRKFEFPLWEHFGVFFFCSLLVLVPLARATVPKNNYHHIFIHYKFNRICTLNVLKYKLSSFTLV